MSCAMSLLRSVGVTLTQASLCAWSAATAASIVAWSVGGRSVAAVGYWKEPARVAVVIGDAPFGSWRRPRGRKRIGRAANPGAVGSLVANYTITIGARQPHP